MTLAIGAHLGPYEVLGSLGAGGMAEVYRARDTRLDRTVAIKVLPEHVASDPELRQRFDREAKALAALSHPHICPVYDVGRHVPSTSTARAGADAQPAVNFLVMEYLEGETLAQRLAKGALPLDQALQVAIQIAGALDKAHRNGIVHRDLKPGNVMLARSGAARQSLPQAKLLDFGLAKLRPVGGPSAAALSEAPTVSSPLTGAGTILGTFQYMAPEQLEGKEADARTDIFAFGAVVYEMVTGKKAFEGTSQASLIAAILEREPASMSSLQPMSPPALDRVVKKCVAKSPDLRWQAASDLADELIWIQSLPDSRLPAPTNAAARRPPLSAWVLAGALAVAVAVAAAGWWRDEPPADEAVRPLVRLDVDLGPDESLGVQEGANVILSPDGMRLVYVSWGRLVTRRLDQARGVELPATEGATGPFFSPDGQWLAFFAGGKLKKMSVDGGAAITLCDAPNGRGGAWGEDGYLIASLGNGRGLERIPSTGGAPMPITSLAEGELDHAWPQILPDGSGVMFTSNNRIGGWDRANVDVVSLTDGTRKTLVRGGTFGRYLGSGHLAYVNGGTLFAASFDPVTLTLRGTPVPIIEEVAYSTSDGSVQMDASRSGVLVYRSGSTVDLTTLQWLDRAGAAQPLLTKPGDYSRPLFSPDGRRLALGLNGDLWVYEWQRDTLTRLTFEGGANYSVWSPDGQYLVFRSAAGMSWIRSDGAGRTQVFAGSAAPQWPWSFTPDGRRLAFQERTAATGWDLWTAPMELDNGELRLGKPQVLLQTTSDEQNPSFSPDGRWIAYSSNESGLYQVYVRAFSDTGGKWQVSSDAGRQPEWSRSSQELVFRSADNQIMAVAYTVKGDSFLAERPRAWSSQRLAQLDRNGMYDLTPDGTRIAAMMPADTPGAAPRGFPRELLRRAAAARTGG